MKPSKWMILETTDVSQEKLQCLTTHLMQWSPNVWILDLSDFLSYWKRQSVSLQIPLLALWRIVLQQTFDRESLQSNVLSLHPSYRACCCNHPWQGVLTLAHMKRRNINGLIDWQSRIGQELYETVEWDTWWECVESIVKHWQFLSKRQKASEELGQQCRRWKQSVAQLGLASPQAMQGLNYQGVQRRFGKRIAQLWRWTVEDATKGHSVDFEKENFPWRDWRPSEPVEVARILDAPIWHWKQVGPWFMEDLDRLCKILSPYQPEYIMTLCWRFTLEDWQEWEVPIHFRHPHRLQKEQGHHKTTLLQAKYGFEQLQKDHNTAALDAWNPIIEWTITIQEKLVIPPMLINLFGEIDPLDEDKSRFHQLDNQLPIPLQRFRLVENWEPETSFQPLQWEPPAEAQAPFAEAYNAVAQQRPLFLYKTPQTIDTPSQTQLHFLESVMPQWWDHAQSHGERHYYKMTNPQGKMLWVFRESNTWYLHGVFG